MNDTQNLFQNNNSENLSEEMLVKTLKKHNYELKESIGKGGYGKIYKVFHKLENKFCVVKVVKFNEETEQGLKIKNFTLKESSILWNLKHPNIIKLYEIIIDIKGALLLIIELAENGVLISYLDEKLSEENAFAIFYQIFSGVKNMHEAKIIHRDLKLENILVDAKFNLKICDFGLSKDYVEESNEENKTQEYTIIRPNIIKEKLTNASFVGSPFYLSPEIISGGDCFLDSVDIWSLGIIFYSLIFNEYPFEIKEINIKEFEEKIVNKELKIKPNVIKPDCQDFLKKFLEKNFVNRIRIKNVEEHPWFKRMFKTKKIQDYAKNLSKYLEEKKKKNLFQTNEKLSISIINENPSKELMNTRIKNKITNEIENETNDYRQSKTTFNVVYNDKKNLIKVDNNLNKSNYDLSKNDNKNLNWIDKQGFNDLIKTNDEFFLEIVNVMKKFQDKNDDQFNNPDYLKKIKSNIGNNFDTIKNHHINFNPVTKKNNQNNPILLGSIKNMNNIEVSKNNKSYIFKKQINTTNISHTCLNNKFHYEKLNVVPDSFHKNNNEFSMNFIKDNSTKNNQMKNNQHDNSSKYLKNYSKKN